MNLSYCLRAVLALLFFCSTPINAQTLANVWGSVINPEDRSVEYRIAFVPDEGTSGSSYAHRFHYQRAFKENFRWRGIIQGREKAAGGLELDMVQGEMFWQIKNKLTHGWDSALRLDVQLNQNGRRSDRFSLNWSGQGNFSERWRSRAVVLFGREFGELSNSGVSLQVGTQLAYRLTGGANLALEMFNTLGQTSSLGSFQDQNHRIGPAYIGRFSNGLSFHLGALFGLSDVARSVDLRLFLSKAI